MDIEYKVTAQYQLAIKQARPWVSFWADIVGDFDLGVEGITNPVTFEISLYKENTYRATLVFDRSKFDVRYGSDSFFDNLGDRVILNEIELVVDLVIMYIIRLNKNRYPTLNVRVSILIFYQPKDYFFIFRNNR